MQIPDDDLEDDDDGLNTARGIFGSAFMSAVVLLPLVWWLASCAPSRSNTQQPGIDDARVSLTKAETAAIDYIHQPLCGPTHPAPRCSEAAKIEEIKRAAQYAKESINVAQIAGTPESLATANAAITKLVAITPKPAS